MPDPYHLAGLRRGTTALLQQRSGQGLLAAVEELLVLAESDSSTVMCSESVWWRCHRRLLADHLVLMRGIAVVHLMHDGRSTPHVPTEGVRIADDALVYDVGVTPLLSVP